MQYNESGKLKFLLQRTLDIYAMLHPEMTLKCRSKVVMMLSLLNITLLLRIKKSLCYSNCHRNHVHKNRRTEHYNNFRTSNFQAKQAFTLFSKNISSETLTTRQLFHKMLDSLFTIREPKRAQSNKCKIGKQMKSKTRHRTIKKGLGRWVVPLSSLCLLLISKFTALGFQIGTEVDQYRKHHFHTPSLITTDRCEARQNSFQTKPITISPLVFDSVIQKKQKLDKNNNYFKNNDNRYDSYETNIKPMFATLATPSGPKPLIESQPSLVAVSMIAVAMIAIHSSPALASAAAAARAAAAASGAMTVALPVIDLSILWKGLQHIVWSLIPTLVLALIQGSAAILNYKNNFGDAPPPKVPAHGVVISTKTSVPNNMNEDPTSTIYTGTALPVSSLPPPTAAAVGNKDFLRLLLIGDSLAVGIGQSRTCTPVMPESIAKEISKATGKAVYWTCHGESGASTSWIVRMLQNSTEIQDDVEEAMYKPPDFVNWEGKARRFSRNYFVNGTDEYAAAGLWAESFKDNNHHPYSPHIWKQRLAAYRKNFDPAAMGPYDIVVLLTGPNDLKTMLFPFMLEEEDKVYYEHLQGKKPGVVDDLTTLMQTINQKVERRLEKTLDGFREKAETIYKNICERSEAIRDTIQVLRSNQTINEKMEHSILMPMESLRAKTDSMSEEFRVRAESLSKTIQLLASSDGTFSEKVEHGIKKPLEKLKEKTTALTDDIHEGAAAAFKMLRHNLEDLERLFAIASDYSEILLSDEFNTTSLAINTTDSPETLLSIKPLTLTNSVDDRNIPEGTNTLDVVRPGRPLFVLPGMPARALPAFRKAPLKWLAVPVFDLMDKKKRELAAANPDILFVNDPQLDDIIDYENRNGRIWKQVREEQVLLSLKDIGKIDCTTIEQSMRGYFASKNAFIENLDKTKPLSELEGLPGTKIFSVDRIHPNDFGYDFWGRHIGSAIVQQLQKEAQESLVEGSRYSHL